MSNEDDLQYNPERMLGAVIVAVFMGFIVGLVVVIARAL
jgi:hypothetical protein